MKNKSDKEVPIPVARREFTTVECYINVSRYAENGHFEAVRQNREICPNHLDLDLCLCFKEQLHE